MHTRRLVKAGQASHTIALPKEWILKNNLKKGDVIYVNNISDKELSISPESTTKQEQKEITILTEKKDIGTIQREITSAYINNYNTINIIGDDLNKKAKEIRKIMQDFVALEIAEQTSTKIIGKDLLNLDEISVEQTIKRMDMIIRSIIQDSTNHPAKDILESISFRDYDVNRLYFLLSRILKSAMNNPSIASSIKISNDEILSKHHLIINLENLADSCKDICDCFSKLDNQPSEELIAIFKQVEKNYLDIMNSLYKKDKKTADIVASKRQEIIGQCDDYFKKNNKGFEVKIIEELKEMENFICNIARIVLDTE